MAYQRPIVMVFQEYAKLSVATQTATLAPCIVGPCYQVMDPTTDEDLAYATKYVSAGITNFVFPNLYAGAIVDAASVKLRFKNPVVAMSANPFDAISVVKNVVTFSGAGTYPAVATVGDYVTVVDNTNAGSPSTLGVGYRIIAVDSAAHTITLNNTLTTEGTAFKITITRQLPEFTLAAPGNSGITVDVEDSKFSVTGVTVVASGSARTLVGGDIHVGYKALRQDLSDLHTVYSVAEATALLGKAVPENTLCYGTSICLANTVVGVKVIGVSSDDVIGYTAAKDRLETAEDVYAIVPMSQDAEIISIFNVHQQQMSTPLKGQWRLCIANTKMITEKVLTSGTGASMVDSDLALDLFVDAEGTFISSGVIPGNTIRVVGSDQATYEYVVGDVIAENMLKLKAGVTFDVTKVAANIQHTYSIVKQLDKTAQAAEIALASKSFGSSRTVNTFPDTCVIDDVELPGYFLSCAVSGMIGGLAPHQGFTRISIAGVGGIKHSNEYFNQSQLDIIAGGGTFVFCQSNASSAPYVRHQLTTDMSTVEFRELSFVKNFDYVSFICKDVLDQFLGKYNVTPSTLGVLSTAVRAVLESLKLYNLPKIGSPVLDYKVTSVAQLADTKDRVEIYVDVTFPYALNVIGLHLVSQ